MARSGGKQRQPQDSGLLPKDGKERVGADRPDGRGGSLDCGDLGKRVWPRTALEETRLSAWVVKPSKLRARIWSPVRRVEAMEAALATR